MTIILAIIWVKQLIDIAVCSFIIVEVHLNLLIN